MSTTLARHYKKHGQSQSLSDAQNSEAQRLAKDYGISYQRLLGCLTKFSLAMEAAGEVRNSRSLLDRSVRLARDVLSVLGAKRGMRLLEQTEPLTLMHRIQTVGHLCDQSVACCTLDELQDQLRRFLNFQKEIQSFLIATGLPPRTYSESPWLFLFLGRLYDTRSTTSPYPQEPLPQTPAKEQDPLHPGNEPIAASAESEYAPYSWVKYKSGRRSGAVSVKRCKYADADLLFDMNPDDAKRLEAERPRFFAARTAVIEELVASCELDKSDGLVERCLEILDRELGRETIQFLLRMDAFYLKGDIRTRDDIEISPKMSPGGLTNLLEVVGHVQEELRTRRMDRMKQSVSEAAFDALFGDGSGTEAYLALTQGPDAGSLDAALDEYAEDSGESRQCWTKFGDTIAKWLHPDFRVPLPLKVRAKHAERLAPIIREYILFLETKADVGEPLVAVPPSEDKNKFLFVGSSWTITFEGKTVALKDLDGYYYIREILKGGETTATELRRRITVWKTSGDLPSRKGRDQVLVGASNSDENTSEMLSVSGGDAGVGADKESLHAAQKQIEALEELIANARSAGEGLATAEYQDERDKIEAYLKANTDRRGQPRLQARETKKAADAVRNAINRALQELEKTHPALHRYLTNHLDSGAVFRCNPPLLDWEL